MLRLTLLLVFLTGASVPVKGACPETFEVGYQVVTYGSAITSVWYPTATPETPYEYGPGVVGSVALDAPPVSCGKSPLVVFSHGYTGCSVQSVFITEQLARRGYVVAAPNHADASCGTRVPPPPQAPIGQPRQWSDQTYLDRRADIEAVLAGILASPDFAPVTDPERIGGIGHSLGGYTLGAMAGAWPSWTDVRIKAVLLLSPYVQPFQVKKTLSGIRVPVMYQGGTLDLGITPFLAAPGGAYDRTPAPKFFAELHAATHFAWTDMLCAKAGSVANCLNSVLNAQLIDAYGFAFLDYYLKQEPKPLLWGNGPGLAEYRHDPKRPPVR
ncbi:MAG: alpha/beta hydrolase family protein [Bryobacteraceae bacterium]